jgi:hypothetical protein
MCPYVCLPEGDKEKRMIDLSSEKNPMTMHDHDAMTATICGAVVAASN